MPLEERKRRWRAMMDVVEKDDVLWWRKNFVEALQGGRQPDESRRPSWCPRADPRGRRGGRAN